MGLSNRTVEKTVDIGRISSGRVSVISYINQISLKFKHKMVISQEDFIFLKPTSKVTSVDGSKENYL